MSYEPTVWVDGDHVTSAKLNKLEQGVNSMSYTPTVWNAGDVVTAEKLNKLEQGVAEGGGGGDYPTFTTDGQKINCDKTFDECYALCENGIVPRNWYCVAELEDGYFVFGTMAIGNATTIGAFFPTEEMALEYKSDGTITPS